MSQIPLRPEFAHRRWFSTVAAVDIGPSGHGRNLTAHSEAKKRNQTTAREFAERDRGQAWRNCGVRGRSLVALPVNCGQHDPLARRQHQLLFGAQPTYRQCGGPRESFADGKRHRSTCGGLGEVAKRRPGRRRHRLRLIRDSPLGDGWSDRLIGHAPFQSDPRQRSDCAVREGVKVGAIGICRAHSLNGPPELDLRWATGSLPRCRGVGRRRLVGRKTRCAAQGACERQPVSQDTPGSIPVWRSWPAEWPRCVYVTHSLLPSHSSRFCFLDSSLHHGSKKPGKLLSRESDLTPD